MDSVHHPSNPVGNVDDENRLEGGSSCRLIPVYLQRRLHAPDPKQWPM